MSRSTAATPSISTNRSQARSAVRPPTARRDPANDSHPPGTSPLFSASTPTPSFVPYASSATKACSSSAAAAASPSPAPPERGVVVERARELLRFARRHGYKPDELIRIIQQLG